MNKWGWFINQKENLLSASFLSNADAWTVISANPRYVEIMERIRCYRPEAKIVVRYWQEGTPLNRDPRVVAREHYDNFYSKHKHVTKMFYPMNEPQLETADLDYHDFMAIRDMWLRLNVWMKIYVQSFRQFALDAYIIFPPAAPGLYWDEPDQTGATLDGITLCRPAIDMCDAVASNCYWPGAESGQGLLWDADWYAFRYRKTAVKTGKPIWISECNGDVREPKWLEHMLFYWQQVCLDDSVLGATCFLLQAHDGQFPQHDVSSRENVGGDLVAIGDNMRSWQNSLTPPAKEDDVEQPVNLEAIVREKAWNVRGIPFNADAALMKFARSHLLGVPETTEFDFEYLNVKYRGQGFSKGIVYAKLDDWSNLKLIPW